VGAPHLPYAVELSGMDAGVATSEKVKKIKIFSLFYLEFSQFFHGK
jgi:hypothetical protein